MSDLTALTLFAGIGSSSRACRNLGAEVVGAVEFMPEAAETLRLNDFKVVEADVREVDFAGSFGQVDIVVGGPPCQPFSQAHDGDGQYDPRDMIPEFIRAVAETLPQVFVMEEVQTLTWKKHAAYLAKVEDDLRALGYVVDHRVINSADLGVPQARKRLFVIGRRVDLTYTGTIFWPWPVAAEEHVTMAQALGWSARTCFERNQQVPDPRAHVLGGPGHAALWPLTRPATTVVGSFRPEVAAAPGYRKAGDGPRQATPGSVVTTFEERLILQDLPTDWKVAGSQAKRDLQVGNSCPTRVIEALLRGNLFP